MGTGYVRQSSANIITGNIIEASDLNAEYNAIESAFNASTGHSHDGTTGEGQKINLTTSVVGVLPIANGGTGFSAFGSISTKTTPVDADSAVIVDSADSNNPKRLTFSNLWVWIQSKFSGSSTKATPIDADSINIVDSAASNVAKRLTFSSLWTWVQSKAASPGFTSVVNSGNSTVGGTLGVTGATTLSSTLGVTGNTTLSGTLAVTGATNLNSTLGVTGTTTLGVTNVSSLAASGGITTGGTLGVTGSTTLAGLASTSLSVSGATNLGGTLGVTGTSTLASVSASSLTLTTPLAVAQGGTGSTTVAAARTALFGVSTTVDNTIARYDGVSGALQSSLASISDTGAFETPDPAQSRANFGLGSDGALSNRNRIINGAMMIAQRGASFTGGTTNANDVYTLDRWVLLSDGNDAVDVTQSTEAPADGLNSIALDVETANKKFGILQIIEQKNCIGLIGNTVTLSFKAKASSTTKLDNLKAAIIAWDGTANSVTSDIISAWGAEDTNPTLVANWTYENSPVNLTPTTSWASYSVSASVDTASTKNIAVFIWSDVTDTTAGDFLYITDVQLEAGSVATPFEHRSLGVEVVLCQRYYQTFIGYGDWGNALGYSMFSQMFPVRMRASPTTTRTLNAGSEITSLATAEYVVVQVSGISTSSAPYITGTASAEL